MGNQQGKLQRLHHHHHHHHHDQHQVGTTKKSVHWKTAECPSSPGRPALLALPDQPPDVICLRWERSKLDGGSPITGYTVEHRRVGSPHWVRAIPIPTLRCEICISGLEPGWRYQFRVFAENVVGRSEPSDLSDILTVTLQRNAICVPRFLDELQNLNAVENERVEFRVRFMGHPAPEINWFKDGYEIFSSRRTKIISDNESSVLIIHQVALTDEGEIRCTATNRAGHVVTKANLLVQAPPKIRLPRTYEDGLIVEAEEILRLKVGIAGQPPPLVTWIHDSGIIMNGGRFEITNSERNSMLKIDNVHRDDRGEYSVKAVNALGEDIASFLVTITSRPTPPGKVRLNMSFGKSVTLSWAAPIDDGGCKIGNYILEYFRIGWNVWLKAATTRSLHTTLHDLIEGSEYKFRVKAENPYGLSDPSEESDILFIPDPKRGITKPKSAELKFGNTEERKALSPRRKTVSPPARSVADAATETAALKKISPKSLRKYKPQLLDTDDLHREMSYGTSDTLLKQEIRKSPSPYRNHIAQPTPKAIEEEETMASSVKQPQTTSTLKVPESVPFKGGNKVSEGSPIRDIMKISLNVPKKESKTQAQASSENILENSKENEIFNEENVPKGPLRKPFSFQNFIKAEDTWQRNNILSNETHQPEIVKGVTNTAALERSSEPVRLAVNEQGKTIPNKSFNSMLNLPNLSVAIATSKLGELEVKENIEEPPERLSEATNLATSSSKENIRSSLNGLGYSAPQVVVSTILSESSIPSPIMNNHTTRTTARIPIQSNEQHDDVHTSNEFMVVVFNKNSKVKDKDKQDSFELDLEDAIQSPPISMSAPDLALLEYTSMRTNFPIRRSVSSTELLYERAMARFYEAVELEEAERARKLRTVQDKLTVQQSSSIRKRLGSISEAERLSFERRSELRKQSTDIIGTTMRKWTSKENVNASAMIFNEPESYESQDDRFDYNDEQRHLSKENSFEIASDYTESTASSDEDSIEKFKIELEARTSPPISRELETYHPRNMSAGVFTPYRLPTKDEAAIVLTRPVPLPSPDFIPKPILKKPSSKESVTSPGSSDTEIPTNKTIQVHSGSEKLDLSKSIKSFFKRDPSNLQRSPSPSRNSIPIPLSISIPNGKDDDREDLDMEKGAKEKSAADALLLEAAKKRQAKEEEERRKRLEAERIMKEEAQAAADHYSDLVRQVSTTKKYNTPVISTKSQGDLEKTNVKVGIKVEAAAEAMVDKEREAKRPDKEETVPKREESVNSKVKVASLEKPQSVNATASIGSLMAVKLMKSTNENVSVVQQKVQEVEDEKTIVIKKSIQKEAEEAEEAEGEGLVEISSTVLSETVEERPDSRGRPRLVKVKRIMKKRIPSGTRSRETSSNRSQLQASLSHDVLESEVPLRDESLKKLPAESLDSFNDLTEMKEMKEMKEMNLVSNGEKKSIEELSIEAHENVRSALSYSTDFILFIVACYVYLFKDARLVLPILALMIYRQVGEAIMRYIPAWLKRKKP